MKSVGIKDLKNNLSRCLREVRAGETLWVTDRNKVIAEIHRPREGAPEKLSRLEAWLQQQERDGNIRAAKPADAVPSLRETWLAQSANLPPLDIGAVLDETRDDCR